MAKKPKSKKNKKRTKGIYCERITIWITKEDKEYLRRIRNRDDTTYATLGREALNEKYPGHFEEP